MYVEHFGGLVEVLDDGALEKIMSARFGDDANEFFLFPAPRYPLLAVLSRADSACVHYFPTQEHPGFVSMGNEEGSAVAFYTNTPSERMEVAAEHVIPFSRALEAAKQFL